MPDLDASRAECLVFTFKEGLLSKIAHDLKIRVGDFQLSSAEDGKLIATARADSLRVVTAMRAGSEAPSLLSAADKDKIAGNIRNEVLHSKKHPEIRFESNAIEGDGDERTVSGTLQLHGNERSVKVTAKRAGDHWVAELSLHQPDFGIKPYSAMLGTLKVQPNVTVRVSVPVG